MNLWSPSRTSHRCHRHTLGLLLTCCLFAGACFAEADDPAASSDDITQLSLEELDALSISAASKRSQPLFETPAAVSVLLPVDIRRAGHASMAEALRLITGVHVIDQLPGRWNVGVRGANGIQSTKLLVLVDGRSVYGPFYGGVEWTNVDIPLDDLARIEVVRGPGATLWGANAVNGVVNIISKDARDTQGSLVSLRAGTGEPARAHVRYGGKAGARTWYRVSVGASDTEGTLGARVDDPLADYADQRMGLRTDSVLGERFQLTSQVDFLRGTRRIAGDPSRHQLGSVLTRLQGRNVAGGDLQLQLYYDRSRDRVGGSDRGGTDTLPFALNETTENIDLDLTHHVRVGSRQELIWGGGARRTENTVVSTQNLHVDEPTLTSWLYNLFVQDEIALTPKTLRLTLGTKLERHDSIGWLLLPNARLAWTPGPRHTVWAAASQAARAPSRGEREILLTLARIPASQFAPGVRVEVSGNPHFDAEINNTHELGWRWRPTPRFQTDVTGYFFDYNHVRTLNSTTSFEPGFPPTVVQRYTIGNEGDASAYGTEFSWLFRAGDRWELGGGISHEIVHTEGIADNPLVTADYAIPDWIWHVRSWWQLSHTWEFSTTVYGTGENDRAQKPGYLRYDAQLVWNPRPEVELSLGVQNAGDPRHSEVITGNLTPTADIRRNVYARIQWRF